MAVDTNSTGILKVRADAAAWRAVDAEIIVLQLESSDYISLNSSAAALWLLMVEGTTRDELVEFLAQRFGLDEPTASRDVDAFIEECRAGDLLES